MTLEEKRTKYLQLCHAMQSGVAAKMNRDNSDTLPKHLRVGVNFAMVDSAALATLLMKKGIITEEEYYDALIERMQAEVAAYEAWLNESYGANTKNKRG